MRLIEAQSRQALALVANLEHPAEGVAIIDKTVEVMGGG